MKILLGFLMGTTVSVGAIGYLFIATTVTYKSTLFRMDSIHISSGAEPAVKSLPLVTEYIASNRRLK